jgi:hypothetical protein
MTLLFYGFLIAGSLLRHRRPGAPDAVVSSETT